MCRYSDRYRKIISHYQKAEVTGFTERHHIMPKCMGGNDEGKNLVYLPPKAHFIVHYLLTKMYPDNKKLKHAFAMMGVSNQHQDRKQTGKLYEFSKKARSEALTGQPRPEWVKKKLRRPKSRTENYFGNTNAKGNLGKKYKERSKEHTQKLVESQRKFQEQRKKDRLNKCKHYQSLWENYNGSKASFAKEHNIPWPTMKKYLLAFV